MGILKNYKKIGQEPPPVDKSSLTEEALLDLVSQLLESGDSKAAIARYLGVSRQTIYNYEKKLKQDYISALCGSTFVEIFASELKDIDDKINSYTTLLKGLEDEIVKIEEDIDGTPKVSIENKGSIRDFNDCNRTILNLKKIKNDLLLRMSLNNREGDPNVYGSISDKNIIEHQEIKKLAKEEEVEELLNLLKIEQPKLKNV